MRFGTLRREELRHLQTRSWLRAANIERTYAERAQRDFAEGARAALAGQVPQRGASRAWMDGWESEQP